MGTKRPDIVVGKYKKGSPFNAIAKSKEQTPEDCVSPVSPLNELNPIGTDNYYPFIPFAEVPSIASMSNVVPSKEISPTAIGSKKQKLSNIGKAFNNINSSDIIQEPKTPLF